MTEEHISQTLREFLTAAGIPVREMTRQESPRGVTFAVVSDSTLHTGHEDELLDALTVLFRRIVERRFPHYSPNDISLDLNGHKERQAERLRGVATMLAERAKSLACDVSMEPMTPYERLVIHSFFQDNPNIQTESHGEGRNRHVVIRYVATPIQ